LSEPQQPRALTAKFDKCEIKTAAEPGAAVVDLCYALGDDGLFYRFNSADRVFLNNGKLITILKSGEFFGS
jgi:hypothetical protein